MTAALLVVMLAAGVALCAGAFLLLLQALASLLPSRQLATAAGPVRYAVLIPAHDEALVIEDTVRRALALIGSDGRLIVIADNCGDDTAAKARAAGAQVIERHAPTLRAKGYALAFGIDHLRAEPPDIVVTLDADCQCTQGSFDLLARQAMLAGRPVQALFFMSARPGSRLRLRTAAFRGWGCPAS
jgi:glycosyltransferase involved in cell wall biosynthesis